MEGKRNYSAPLFLDSSLVIYSPPIQVLDPILSCALSTSVNVLVLHSSPMRIVRIIRPLPMFFQCFALGTGQAGEHSGKKRALNVGAYKCKEATRRAKASVIPGKQKRWIRQGAVDDVTHPLAPDE